MSNVSSEDYKKNKNVYLNEIKGNLPRILSLIDLDITNNSLGMTDRLHWSWKLKDFSNATGQGMINGICRLWVKGLWPYETSKDFF